MMLVYKKGGLFYTATASERSFAELAGAAAVGRDER